MFFRQIPNMRSAATAVCNVKPGDVLPEESLKRLKKQAEENGLIFNVKENSSWKK